MVWNQDKNINRLIFQSIGKIEIKFHEYLPEFWYAKVTYCNTY